MTCMTLPILAIASVFACAAALTTSATAHDNYGYKHDDDDDHGEMSVQLGPRPVLPR